MIGRIRCFSSRLIREPEQIADWVSEQLIHDVILNQPDSCEAAQYDLSGNVLKRSSLLRKNIPEKRLRQLFEHGKYIHLDKCSLDDFDALVVSRAARFINQSIHLLDLNGNPLIADVGADHISRHVLKHTGIRSLFMSDCSLTDACVNELSSAIFKNEHLGIIELRKNAISDSGAEALAEAFINNPFHREINIYLSDNKITEQGVVALTKATLSRTTPLKVWLSGNNIPDEVKLEISRYTKNIRF